MSEGVNKEKLLSDLKVLIGDAEELLKATASQAGERVGEARKHIERSLEEGKKNLSKSQELLVNKSQELAKATEDYVRDNPWNAVGIAAGVGLVLGLLMRRS